MSDKGRVLVIFTVIAGLLGGGLFYFLKIYQPKQEQKGAQAEIAVWEARWAEARACLLGDKPASAKASEALAVRELSPDPWNRGTCSKLIGKLSRGVADDTGIMKVEHAWMTIDRAAAKVATSFASHVDPFGDLPEKRGSDPLPEALEELDAAQAELRQAAGMSPPPGTEASLPAAEMIALTADGNVVTTLGEWMLPSSDGLVGFGTTRDREVEMVLTAGGAPKVLLVPSGGARALPSGTWGATSLASDVVVGPIDAKGAFGTMTNVPAGGETSVLFAVGAEADGAVAYQAPDKLGMLRASAGRFTADPMIKTTRIAVALAPTGRALAAWTTEDGAMHGVIASTGAAAKPMELGSGFAGQACLTQTHGWVGDMPQFMSFDAVSATPHVLPQHMLLGCTAKAALLYKAASTTYAVCTDGCRVAELTGTKPSSVAMVVNDKVVAVRTRATVIGLWRENGAPLYFTTPVAFEARTAITDGKVIDVVGQTHDGLAIARLAL